MRDDRLYRSVMQTAPVLQIKLLIRYSYPSDGGFRRVPDAGQRIQHSLYGPDRLAVRERLFRRLCLPSVVGQTDAGFSAGLLIGDDFPERPAASLVRAIDPLHNMHLLPMPPLPHFRATRKAFGALPGIPGATHTVSVRLDDDDAMHPRTIETIRRIASGLIAMRGSDRPFAIAFNRGVFVTLGKRGAALEVIERTPIGIGLAVVAPVNDPVNVFRYNHRKLAEFMDVYSDAHLPAWVRSIHPGNDSGVGHFGRVLTRDRAAIGALLQKEFALSLDQLEAEGFPGA